MNSSPFWEAFNGPEPERWRPVPINAWETPLPKARDYAGDFQTFCRDVLGHRIWDQTAKTLKAIASWNGKVRLLTPLEQYSTEKLWFRRWWERMGLPLWRGEPVRTWGSTTLCSGKLFHPPIPRGPGRSLLEWTIYSGWPGNSPPSQKAKTAAHNAAIIVPRAQPQFKQPLMSR